MKNILLINAESVQTLCLARSLRRLGHHVVGFCTHRISSGYVTRWLSERILAPDIVLHPQEFQAFLLEYLTQHPVDLIIPLGDEGAEYLSQNKQKIQDRFHLKCAVPEPDQFALVYNKQTFMAFCEQHHFSHPCTCGIDPRDLKQAADVVGFPALIKPNVSQGAGES